MSTISLAGTKAFVFDLIHNEDHVTEKGQLQKRTLFKKELIRDLRTLKDKLLKSVEVGWVPMESDPKNLKFEDLQWTSFPEWKQDGRKLMSERWVDGVVELSAGEKKVAKHYYEERDLLLETTTEVWAEFEKEILS
jgi:hypothetical protein